jgi:hypothetical protein
MEQTTDVPSKGTYPLSYTMIPLNYSMEVTFECGLEDANVVELILDSPHYEGTDSSLFPEQAHQLQPEVLTWVPHFL